MYQILSVTHLLVFGLALEQPACGMRLLFDPNSEERKEKENKRPRRSRTSGYASMRHFLYRWVDLNINQHQYFQDVGRKGDLASYKSFICNHEFLATTTSLTYETDHPRCSMQSSTSRIEKCPETKYDNLPTRCGISRKQ